MVALGLMLGAEPCAARQGIGTERDDLDWVDDFALLGANALVGGLTAGIVSWLRGGSFRDAVFGGAVGGQVAYVGKRVAASRFDGAGLLGRTVGAAGGSMTRNASLEIGLLDSLLVPVGPLRLQWSPRGGGRPGVLLDLNETYWIAYGGFHPELTFDWKRSLSAGTAVFRTTAHIGPPLEGTLGLAVSSIVVLRDRPGDDVAETFAHERVHVLQNDYVKATMGYPLERWVRRRLHVPEARATRPFLIGLGYYPFLIGFSGAWPDDLSLFQVEAELLER